MGNICHILNGDCLFEQFPPNLDGQIIVFRECLCDGPVTTQFDEEFFSIRSEFIEKAYGESAFLYLSRSKSELEKIKDFQPESTVYLWFEYDLFCQVNMWACIAHLSGHKSTVFWVKPLGIHGFSDMTDMQLKTAWTNAHQLKSDQLEKMKDLWRAYCQNDSDDLLSLAEYFNRELIHVSEAILLHLQCLDPGHPSHPFNLLKSLRSETGKEDFTFLFKEYSRRYPQYGYGDLQLYNLYRKLYSD